jgi:hypothetical protein
MFTNIRKWISNPNFDGDDEKNRTASLLNTIIFISIVAAVSYGVFSPIDRSAIPLRVMIIAPFVLVLTHPQRNVPPFRLSLTPCDNAGPRWWTSWSGYVRWRATAAD